MRRLRKKLKFEAPGIVPLKKEAKAAGVCELVGSHPENHLGNTTICYNGDNATGTNSGDCGAGGKGS